MVIPKIEVVPNQEIERQFYLYIGKDKYELYVDPEQGSDWATWEGDPEYCEWKNEQYIDYKQMIKEVVRHYCGN